MPTPFESFGQPPELPTAADALREQAFLNQLSPERRHAFRFPEQHAIEAINRGGPQWLRQRAHDYRTTDVLQAIHATTQRMMPMVEGRSGLRSALPSLQFPPVITREIDAILGRMTQQAPNVVGGQRNKQALYLTQAGKGTSTEYSVDAARISRDTQFIDSMLMGKLPPEQRNYLQTIRSALTSYGWSIDPQQMAVQEYNDARGKSRLNQGLRYGLRFGTVLGAGTMAVVNGIISWRQNIPSAAPWLYGGLAMFAADPSLLNGKALRVANQANTAVAALEREGNARQFSMEGANWSTFAQQAMTGRFDRSAMRQIGWRQTNTVLPEDQRRRILAGIAPENTTPQDVRTGLDSMLAAGRLGPFLNAMRSVRTPDAQQLVARYIREGAWRLGNVPHNVRGMEEIG
jgi:hypothetical protein